MTTLRNLFRRYKLSHIDFLFPYKKFKCSLKYLEICYLPLIGIGLSISPILNKNIFEEGDSWDNQYLYPEILDVIVKFGNMIPKEVTQFLYIKIITENGYSTRAIDKIRLDFGDPIVDVKETIERYEINIEELNGFSLMELDFLFQNKNCRIIFKYNPKKYKNRKEILKKCEAILNNEIINYNKVKYIS